jgi:hypothetical protein
VHVSMAMKLQQLNPSLHPPPALRHCPPRRHSHLPLRSIVVVYACESLSASHVRSMASMGQVDRSPSAPRILHSSPHQWPAVHRSWNDAAADDGSAPSHSSLRRVTVVGTSVMTLHVRLLQLVSEVLVMQVLRLVQLLRMSSWSEHLRGSTSRSTHERRTSGLDRQERAASPFNSAHGTALRR